ncbi:MAG: leucyl/phenylalanyl-tRNA--protein transferase, partial [Polynucleobacter sp.]|nr:leucyl/phenylalanyl-tRNA--protein transferase [Polynucleobacter sp.]
GQSGTWITDEMRAAYRELHRLGHAHSVETWIDDKLAGGLYGIAIGQAFFGESMFSDVRDTSKIALAHLCAHLKQSGFGIIDCQMETTHLASLGARPIRRRDYVMRLDDLCQRDGLSGSWPASGIDGHFRKQQ